MADYTGLSLEEARRWGWDVAIHPDDLERLLTVWEELRRSGQPGEVDARHRRHDGQYRGF